MSVQDEEKAARLNRTRAKASVPLCPCRFTAASTAARSSSTHPFPSSKASEFWYWSSPTRSRFPRTSSGPLGKIGRGADRRGPSKTRVSRGFRDPAGRHPLVPVRIGGQAAAGARAGAGGRAAIFGAGTCHPPFDAGARAVVGSPAVDGRRAAEPVRPQAGMDTDCRPSPRRAAARSTSGGSVGGRPSGASERARAGVAARPPRSGSTALTDGGRR